MFLSLQEDLTNNFQGQIPNLIFFAIGIGIGIILFLLAFLIVYIISKSKKVIDKSSEDIIINDEYKIIITSCKDKFNNYYIDSSIKEKTSGIIKITMDMMEEIALLYFPDSDEPIFEISIDRLVDFLAYFTKRIDYITDNLLEERFQAIELITKIQLKETKLSKLMELLEKNKNKPKENENGLISKIKNKLFSGVKKIAYNISQSTINYTFNTIIDDLGEDINKLYSNQKLEFTQLSKKEIKRIKKQEKKAKRLLRRNAGDENA